MDTIDFVAKSKEMEALRKLCTNLNIDYRVILKSKDGISTTIGNMQRRDSDEILAENVPPEPQEIILPDLPYSYDDLMSANNQYEMVKFVLVLVQLYIGTKGILGEGKINCNNDLHCFRACSLL